MMLRSSTLLALAIALGSSSVPSADLVVGGFEAGYGEWKCTGDAFGVAPYRPRAEQFKAFRGAALAWSGSRGIEATGTLRSPRFRIRRPFLSFLTAGYRDFPADVGVELVVDGRVVRSSSATDHRDPLLRWRTWAVAEFVGRTVQLRVNDRSKVGAIAVDHFVQTAEAKSAPIDASRMLAETYRPQFHFTPRAHWMNDPNGLLHYRGRWHLFYQHTYPGASATVWGHAASTDLFGWKHLPVAISTDNTDANFSGSGLVDSGNASGLKKGGHDPILLFYTLHPRTGSTTPDGELRKAMQCMAYSTDGGVTFRKYERNPILCTPDRNDRDPKVFYYKPTRSWYMVLSLSANNENRPQARYGLFRAKTLDNWELMQSFGPDGWFWECPDMFKMPVEGGAGAKWLLLKGSGDYILGTFDGAQFRPETDKIRMNWGKFYYATQTFNDAPNGRRVQIGWMNTGRPWLDDRYPGMPFNQQMSVPRELRLRATSEGLRLFRYPVKEIEKLRVKTTEWKDLMLKPGTNPLADVRGDLLDIEIEFEPAPASLIILALRGEEVVYETGQRRMTAFGSWAPLAPAAGRVKLRALLDRTSIEVFGNEGESDLSGVFYPHPDRREISLTVRGGVAHIVRIAVHELRSATI